MCRQEATHSLYGFWRFSEEMKVLSGVTVVIDWHFHWHSVHRYCVRQMALTGALWGVHGRIRDCDWVESNLTTASIDLCSTHVDLYCSLRRIKNSTCYWEGGVAFNEPFVIWAKVWLLTSVKFSECLTRLKVLCRWRTIVTLKFDVLKLKCRQEGIHIWMSH